MATVGTNNGSDLTLTRNGVPVTNLTPGRYVIEVRDRSGLHNFHLTGPGVNQATTVAFTGTQTWTLTLAAGTYRFVCDPHATTMRGTFTVSATPPPPARCRVPRVVGRTLATARRLVRRAGCRVGRVRNARSARRRGSVLRQSPRAGVRVRRGTRVTLVVSRGRR